MPIIPPFVTATRDKHVAEGIADKDFERARMNEQVVMWQPGSVESVAMESTPDDRAGLV